MKRRIPAGVAVSVVVLLAVVLGGLVSGWHDSEAQKKKRVLIYLRDNIKENDGPACVAFDAAWAALAQGYSVELMFDQGAAYNLKIFEGDGKTDFQRYDLPQRLKELLAEQFGGSPDQMPKTYQDFLDLLQRKGLLVTVNGTWNALTEIEKTVKGRAHIVKYVQPLDLREMVEHAAAADVVWTF